MNWYLAIGLFFGFWAVVGGTRNRAGLGGVLYAVAVVPFWPLMLLREILIIRAVLAKRAREEEEERIRNRSVGCPTRRYMEETLRANHGEE